MGTERVEFLRGIELFFSLRSEELKWLNDQLTVQQFKRGELLFEENTPREAMGILTEGQIELFSTNPSGEERRLMFFAAGDFLGEGALLEDSPHSTSARALEDASVLLLNRELFHEFVQKWPEASGTVLSRIASVIGRRMQHTSSRVITAGAQYMSGKTRPEHDLLGDREVPFEAFYGIQTLRALENFNITGIPLSHFPQLIVGLAQVKQAAARANHDLGLLKEEVADAIDKACDEIIRGKMHSHFVVDMVQGGAGTSTNMNANEVIANRALEILGHERGEYSFCHPNNHVNLAQSTNDAYPTAMKLALIQSNVILVAHLQSLIKAFRIKTEMLADVIKMGRTQLQDAVPMTLGQEIDAYAATLEEEVERLNENAKLFLEINLGGTAIGTGINAHPEYPQKATRHLAKITNLEVKLAGNLVEATQDTGSFVMYSSALKRLAVKLSKICNDLRLLSSGPRAGLNEINLPKMQPGSSIMPGKVNPVIPEVVNQIAFKVIGNDLTVTLAAEAGQLELNVMEPVIVQSLFESIDMLQNGMKTLRLRCIEGITANKKHCREQTLNSIGLVTALNPKLGYEVCTALARQALEEDRSVGDLVLEKGLLSEEELDELLKPENMIQPGQ